ncbi:DUF421 domain-containing protein [Catenuloplanes indicus]|uniref:Uncharacterized membrane protein YcaP (DUF421 family) n=1 Tax=Catenuloplanes indicus TaxID=137267 RepID=A0AAE3VWR0_9ACTN|nr:YetF domain-containing protein [Catenuloplanes indicus]MDQ0365154.1 uncharacterized membrane protein YcaP (DUF421 family) [Catenuloplanes indicus]
MFFDTFYDLWRIAAVGVLTYLLLITVLRFSGKRTLAKMNAFDLVVTVALGSTLATILLTRDVALLEGLVAFTVLVGLQFAVSWVSVRSGKLRELVKSDPTLLLLDGELLDGTLRRQRITEGEILQAVRAQGIGDLTSVAAVVLESDGSFSVIPRQQAGARSALRDVHPTPRRAQANRDHHQRDA